MSVVNAFDDLVLEPFLQMSRGGLQLWNAIDDVDGQVEAVDLVQDRQFERCVDVALFLISANVEVVMILAPIRELVDERGIGVEVEDDRLIERE